MSDAKSQGRTIRAAIIDMDDTLYAERDYFLGGLDVVSAFVAPRLRVPVPQIRQELDALHAEPGGRGELFDRLLLKHAAWSAGLAATLVQVYRTHRPRLQAFRDVAPVLQRLRECGLSVALLTDGPATVQRAKFESLGLAELFDARVFTDELPAGGRKPSTLPFLVAAELLAVSPEQCVAVADDPAKDFLGPRALGMYTVRIRRPLRFPLQPRRDFPSSHEADTIVDSLEPVTDIVSSLAKC